MVRTKELGLGCSQWYKGRWQNETQEISLKWKKKLFYYETSQTLAEAAQRVGRVSFKIQMDTVPRNLLQLAQLWI